MNTIIDVFSSKFKKSESDKSITKGFGQRWNDLEALSITSTELWSINYGPSLIGCDSRTWKLGPVVEIETRTTSIAHSTLKCFFNWWLGHLKKSIEHWNFRFDDALVFILYEPLIMMYFSIPKPSTWSNTSINK